MEKVKMFHGWVSSSTDFLEKNVNKWLADNPNVDITSRLQTDSQGSFVVTIFYKEGIGL